MVKMIGKLCPTGPGGTRCQCCSQVPGKDATARRRAVKRRERLAWLRDTARELADSDGPADAA